MKRIDALTQQKIKDVENILLNHAQKDGFEVVKEDKDRYILKQGDIYLTILKDVVPAPRGSSSSDILAYLHKFEINENHKTWMAFVGSYAAVSPYTLWSQLKQGLPRRPM